ncbi:hypothetical protein JXM67_04020 [candidate division WOR-3 bacterium]|nr:hypothetical protein [candidate division WOR-3 bacterium]
MEKRSLQRIDRVVFFSVIIATAIVSPLGAQEALPVSYSGLGILDLSFGARGLALGEVMQAVPADRFSLYNNPATSAFAEQTVVIAGVQNMGLVSCGGIIGLFPFKFGTFSIGIKGATVDGLEVRPDPSDPDFVRDTTAAVMAVPALSFARKFGTISAGLTLRAQTVSLGYNPANDEQLISTAVGLDIGAYQDFKDIGLGLGFVVQNLGPRMYFIGGEEDSVGTPQPTYIAASVRYSLLGNKLHLLAGPGFGSRGFAFSTGVEFSPWEIFSLRIGYATERLADNFFDGFAAGFGLQLSNLEINYSYLPNTQVGGAGGGIHGIDLGFHFGASAVQKERLLAEARAQAEKEALERQKLTSKSLYEQGLTQYNMKQYDEALRSWDMALIWWPDNTDARNMIDKVTAEKDEMKLNALVNQAKQAYVSKNYVALMVMTEQILAQDSAHSLALFYREEAEKKATEELIANAPAPVQEDLRGGIAALAEQDYLTAMNSFEKVLDFDPGNSFAQDYIRKTQAEIDRYISEQVTEVDELLGRNRYNEAKSEVRELLELAPQNSDLLQKLGEIDTKLSEDVERRMKRAQETEDAARSEKELQTVLQLDPTNQQAQQNLNEVQKTTKKTQDVQTLYLLGVESYSENNYELAISYWQRVLAIDPNHANARKNLGRAQSKLAALKGS